MAQETKLNPVVLDALLRLDLSVAEKIDVLDAILQGVFDLRLWVQMPSLKDRCMFKAYMKIYTSKDMKTLVVAGKMSEYIVQPPTSISRYILKVVEGEEHIWLSKGCK